MEQLLKKGAGLGLNPSQIEEALCLGRPANDGAWIESQDLLGMAQTVAIENMEEGRFIEYCCLDGRGQPQGRGMVKLMKWEAEDDCLFVGEHGPSSDEYYDWYVNNTGRSGFLYHVCPCQASKCKVKKARGDARELIHVEKWRLLTPKLMVHQKYLEKDGLKYGEDELVKMARDLKGPAPHGTGLDAAHLALAAGAGKDDSGEKGLPSKVDGLMGPSGLDPTERGRKRGREPMGDFLAKQVSKHQANVGPEKKKRKKKKKVKERREGEISLSISSSSSESSGFQAAPVRGGQELWRIAQKKPGHLTRLALDEMTRYLADKMEENEVEIRWRGQKVQAYLNQILFVTHQPSKVGLRTSRELSTLGITLDHLLAGRLAQATDALMQRLKALEASLQEGGWQVAKHLEIIPPQGASLMREAERDLATKNELKSLKLKEAVQKMQKASK